MIVALEGGFYQFPYFMCTVILFKTQEMPDQRRRNLR
jgi:hypothetical protein